MMGILTKDSTKVIWRNSTVGFGICGGSEPLLGMRGLEMNSVQPSAILRRQMQTTQGKS